MSNIVAIVSDPTTDGYYLIGSDGSVWTSTPRNRPTFPFFGIHVNDDRAWRRTPDDQGFYLVGGEARSTSCWGTASPGRVRVDAAARTRPSFRWPSTR